MHTFVAFTLALLIGPNGCTHDRQAVSEPSNKKDEVFGESLAKGQTRLNQYFRSATLNGSFKDCWNQLQGRGLIGIDVQFTKTEVGWLFDLVEAQPLDLPEGQGALALQCMDTALRSTTFPVTPDNGPERVANAFVARWTWPVPLPATNEELVERYKDTGYSDAADKPRGCAECVSRSEYPYGMMCEDKDRGGHLDCQEQATNTNVCDAAPTACVRGYWGVAGAS